MKPISHNISHITRTREKRTVGNFSNSIQMKNLNKCSGGAGGRIDREKRVNL